MIQIQVPVSAEHEAVIALELVGVDETEPLRTFLTVRPSSSSVSAETSGITVT